MATPTSTSADDIAAIITDYITEAVADLGEMHDVILTAIDDFTDRITIDLNDGSKLAVVIARDNTDAATKCIVLRSARELIKEACNAEGVIETVEFAARAMAIITSELSSHGMQEFISGFAIAIFNDGTLESFDLELDKLIEEADVLVYTGREVEVDVSVPEPDTIDEGGLDDEFNDPFDPEESDPDTQE